MPSPCEQLYAACFLGDFFEAKRILYAVNMLKSSPKVSFASVLHIAVDRNHVDIVKLLLDYRFNVNSCHFDKTPLHWASLRGHVKVAELLIQYGADVRRRDNCAKTPLALAVEHNVGEEIVRLLVKASNFPGQEKPQTQHEVLMQAISHGNVGVLGALLENVVSGGDLSVNWDGLLQKAVMQERVDCTKLLLQKGANTEPKKNGHMLSVLRLAIQQDLKEVALLLVNYGVDVFAQGKLRYYDYF